MPLPSSNRVAPANTLSPLGTASGRCAAPGSTSDRSMSSSVRAWNTTPDRRSPLSPGLLGANTVTRARSSREDLVHRRTALRALEPTDLVELVKHVDVARVEVDVARE